MSTVIEALCSAQVGQARDQLWLDQGIPRLRVKKITKNNAGPEWFKSRNARHIEVADCHHQLLALDMGSNLWRYCGILPWQFGHVIQFTHWALHLLVLLHQLLSCLCKSQLLLAWQPVEAVLQSLKSCRWTEDDSITKPRALFIKYVNMFIKYVY